MNQRRLKVLTSTGPLKRDDNPYLQQLVSGLNGRVDVEPLSGRAVLFSRPDVFHVHWPSQLYRADGRAKTHVKRILSAVLLARLRARRVPVVLTAHNIASHEGERGIEKLLLRALERMVTIRIYLNESEQNDRSRGVVILHGDYRGWLDELGIVISSREPERDVILFGWLRRYKGIEELIAAAHDAHATLTITGRAIDSTYERFLAATIVDSPSTMLDSRHRDDDELVAEILRHRLVCLPYQNMYNSGALLYALSVGRPVLAPRSPSNEAIAREVGESWLMLYEGPLTAAILREALNRVPPSGSPDLSRRDWATGIALHIACYRTLVDAASRRIQPNTARMLLAADPAFRAHSAFNTPDQIL